jgi:AAA domain
MYRCNKNFQSRYANIDAIGQVYVDDYVNGVYNTSTHTPRCMPNGHELVFVNGTKRQPHFRHKYGADTEDSNITEWHLEWQGNFPITEQSFKNRCGQIKDRRADVVISNYKRIIELQHSPIDSSEVKNRNDDYRIHEHNVIWIVDSQNSIQIKPIGDRIVLQFTSNPWLYESFLDCDTVYYDINGFMYKLNPNNVMANQIDVCEPKLKSDFIEALKTYDEPWIAEEPPQSFLYVKQQGAGSGKTYGMMMSLNNDAEIAHYKWIIFITKLHSAKAVMYNEFMEQYNKGSLNNIEMLGEPLFENKKYILHYRHKLTDVEACVIFATVDSFTYAIGEASEKSADTFKGIVQSIKDGVSKVKRSGALKYAGVDPFINKETITMIDETQDLSELYGEAFLKFVSSTHTNLCVVGDRLQSLSERTNALTFLHNAESVGLKVIKGGASNVVRRFSNPRLIQFVNSMIPFDKNDLPPMTPAKIEDELPNALTVFSAKTVYANQSSEDDEVIRSVDQIMLYFKTEVETMNRVPEDFLIVTPFTNKNPLVESLQIAINVFWKDMMENNTRYIENVKSIHPYWKNIDPNEYTRYAIFHKSQEMGSINLSESDHATRMVSIHSSKGDGRKIVFVIGVTQGALQLFSQVANNLIYDSLLHVAITRQKERLYFRLEANEDDIHKRILKSTAGISIESNSEFNYETNSIRLPHVCDDLLKFSFDKLHESVISKNEPPKLPHLSEDEKLLIDMGDHNIRYASMFMNVIVHICNHEQRAQSSTKRQLHAILKNIKPHNIKPVLKLQEYIRLLKENNTSNEKNEYIPVLHFATRDSDRDYNRYFKIILEIMYRVIEELKKIGNCPLNYFCPLESIVLYYMIECVEQGRYQAITINDVYNIVDTYSKVFDPFSKGHDYCKCKSHFSVCVTNLNDAQRKQQAYLHAHYERLAHICSILDRFVSEHPSVNWLYDHAVTYLGAENDEFAISRGHPLIGYDEGCVYVFNIMPQLSELNFNQFITNSIYDTWLIRNVPLDSNNYLKGFREKPVVSCVLSLNRKEIYTVDWTNVVNDNIDFIVNSIYDTLLNKYSTKHEQYYNNFISVVKSNGGDIKSILKECQKSIDPKKTAPYISKFWISFEGKIGECSTRKEKGEKLSRYTEKDTFMKLINGYLDRSLMGFLGMIEDDESDESNIILYE